jgi:hypothetical protein
MGGPADLGRRAFPHERSTTIVSKVVGAVLALLVVSLLVFVSFGTPGGGSDEENLEEIGELDDAARSACATLTPIAGDVRSGELTGPRMFRALQDVFNEARQSETENFSFQVSVLLSAAINDDVQTRDASLGRLEQACAGSD